MDHNLIVSHFSSQRIDRSDLNNENENGRNKAKQPQSPKPSKQNTGFGAQEDVDGF